MSIDKGGYQSINDPIVRIEEEEYEPDALLLTHNDAPKKKKQGVRKRQRRHSWNAGSSNKQTQGAFLNTSEEPRDKRQSTDDLNYMFGVAKWGAGFSHSGPIDEDDFVHVPKQITSDRCTYLRVGNIIWVAFFGWWQALLYLFLGVLMALTIVGLPYAFTAWKMALYVLWPFGKYVVRASVSHGKYEHQSLLPHVKMKQQNPITRWAAQILWWVFFSLIVLPAHLLSCFVTFFFVVTIPMAKVNKELILLMYIKPLEMFVTNSYPGAGAHVELCTHQAVNLHYYKYSLGGVNIFLCNMLVFVAFAIIEGWLVPEHYRLPHLVMFTVDCISIIPIAFYIGMAISSIAAQSNYVVGAVMTASFSSVIDLILYFSAIKKEGGALADLVQASITGSLLAMMLLLPGLSMIAGSIKHLNQRFNPIAAGVGSVLSIVSIIGAFTPTIYYSVYGNWAVHCDDCVYVFNTTRHELTCQGCLYNQTRFDDDPAYTQAARPLMYVCAGVLPIMYIVGLLFTFKTHKKEYLLKREDKEDGHGHGGHHGPEWSRLASVIVLVVATALFALIAENLIDEIKPTINSLGITQQFLGITLIGIVPSFAEFVNAIMFALQDNIALSLEIASSAAVQVALIQVPALVFFSAIVNHGQSFHSFTLIFPLLNVFAVIFANIILNYISVDGRSNYFQGAGLVMIYVILVAAFYFVPDVAEAAVEH